MNPRLLPALALAAAFPLFAPGQDSAGTSPGDPSEPSFEGASGTVRQELEASLSELAALREQIKSEKIPLSRRLSELESELSRVRQEFQETSRKVDRSTLDLSNLRTEIEQRQQEAGYLSNLFGEYIRNFESRIHIAELQRYGEPLEGARLAPENSALSPQEVYQAQIDVLKLSVERLDEALGGTTFEGAALDDSRLVRKGVFLLVGPAALFRSADGQHVGTAEQTLGSQEPAIIAFSDPEETLAASELVQKGEGIFPLDPTLGNAHKIEATEDTFLEHVEKGGPVMVPIFALAGLALLVALYKFFALAFLPRPSRKQIDGLLDAVGRQDEQAMAQKAAALRGPVGKMLAAGIEHIREPRDLIEEVMFEAVLTTRLKLQRMLPFIATCAASAPLLGLLGTVTGIINTFKLITVFGSGDVKTLSGGISEALITTKFGLIVAVPSLLVHAFLSRKARGVIDQMEKAAVALITQVGRHPYHRMDAELTPQPARQPTPRPQERVLSALTHLEAQLKGRDSRAIEEAIQRLNASANELSSPENEDATAALAE